MGLLGTVGLLAAGCGSGDDSSSTSTAAADGGSSGGGEKIAFSITSLTDPYRVITNQLVQRYAGEEGFDLLPTIDANSDPAKQITDFSTAIGQGVKGIVTIVQDSKAIKPALDQAEAKGVPVVALDQGPDDGKVTMVVTTSSIQMGEQACEILGERLRGTGKVLELQGALSGAVGRDRSIGFNRCIEDRYPDIDVVSKPTEWMQERATDAAQTVLSTDKDVNAIFLASDSAMLPGVLTVLRRADRLKPVGEDGHIPMATIDGSPFSLEQVRAGYVDGAISQPLPGYARYAMKYLRGAIAGEEFRVGPTDHDSEIVRVAGGNLADVLRTTIVTKDNASDTELWGNQESTK
jgi:ABC-type sugar transport system substrate-binding protein